MIFVKESRQAGIPSLESESCGQCKIQNSNSRNKNVVWTGGRNGESKIDSLRFATFPQPFLVITDAAAVCNPITGRWKSGDAQDNFGDEYHANGLRL
ncbi:hypothetical protein [Rhizobium skierniewicense]|uniref:hypothetical protein n=1 Tax=Rhizobium skierniewicense TaxID=984260 RepID=UPI0015733E9F|nr:hypothetical protein [Rhizobium skierniewicense]NTF32440.1 hypothetical protein [Rhizobium skierniewicense]